MNKSVVVHIVCPIHGYYRINSNAKPHTYHLDDWLIVNWLANDSFTISAISECTYDPSCKQMIVEIELQ